VPQAIIANLTGLSRMSLYRARDTARVSADIAEVLTPIGRDFEAGKFRSGARVRAAAIRIRIIGRSLRRSFGLQTSGRADLVCRFGVEPSNLALLHLTEFQLDWP
jgi:hypothetical protein